MQKKWKYKTTDEYLVDQLQKQLKISPVFCQMLVEKGITNFEEAKRFFRPEWSHLHNPFLMKGMDKVIHRIEQAIEKEEKILLYGDYDVDGTTSIALMYTFLEPYHLNLDYYIPDRYKEGYGISMEGIDYAKQNGVSLIVAMDCGIKAVEQVTKAKALGIDFIICDHHLPSETIPPAVAILNPKMEDCCYPYKELSACGIMFKFAQAFTQKHSLSQKRLDALLDLVLISSACDIVPLTGENRTLAFLGLKQLNDSPRIGIEELIQRTKRTFPLNVNDIVFGIGPMINAAGRLADAKDSVRLLISKEKSVAKTFAQLLDMRNNKRKEFDKKIAGQAIQLIEEDEKAKEQKSIVLYQSDWHKGVVGIAAARIVEEFYKPTIILTLSGNKVVGSARSVNGFDIHEAIKSCSDLLLNFGGHKYAAGITLLPQNVEAFKKRFEEVVSTTISKDALHAEINITANLHLEEITPKFWNILKQFAPFGPKNRNPIFVSEKVKDNGASRLLKNNHLKLALEKDSEKFIAGIAFGKGQYIEQVKKEPFDVCYNLIENNWMGNSSIQLNVKSIRVG